jgi:hypothetical protein
MEQDPVDHHPAINPPAFDRAPQHTPNMPICATPTAATRNSVLAPDNRREHLSVKLQVFITMRNPDPLAGTRSGR